MKSFLPVVIGILFFAGCGTPEKKQSLRDNPNTRSFTSEMHPYCWINENTLQTHVVRSGSYASKVDSVLNFSYGFRQTLENINNKIPKFAEIRVWILAPEKNPDADVVISIDSAQKNRFWANLNIRDSVAKPYEWTKLSCRFTLPEKLLLTDQVSVYVWGKGNKKEFYVDDLSVSFIY